jgi:hypothetical protein
MKLIHSNISTISDNNTYLESGQLSGIAVGYGLDDWGV